MPVAGWPRERIAERFGRIEGYHRRVFADGTEIKAGEFTDESELALCIVESFTANQGRLDADNIGARFLFLARGEAKRWIGPETLRAIQAAEETLEFRVPLDEDGPATGDVAARGIPIGLANAVGTFDAARLRDDAELVTRVTHGSPAAIAATTAVAYAVNIAARGEAPPAGIVAVVRDFLPGGAIVEALERVAGLAANGAGAEEIGAAMAGDEAAEVVAGAIGIAGSAPGFEATVFAAANAGGPADARAAIAGAIAGAASGTAAIPQPMIDDLEGRIYVSLAVPWFYRSAMRRAGRLIDLRPE
jgi:ADP-ribosylglycohydrolase